jgi:hypothetical protein
MFMQQGDTVKRNFPTFVAHIQHLREILPSATLNVTQFLRYGGAA